MVNEVNFDFLSELEIRLCDIDVILATALNDHGSRLHDQVLRAFPPVRPDGRRLTALTAHIRCERFHNFRRSGCEIDRDVFLVSLNGSV